MVSLSVTYKDTGVVVLRYTYGTTTSNIRVPLGHSIMGYVNNFFDMRSRRNKRFLTELEKRSFEFGYTELLREKLRN